MIWLPRPKILNGPKHDFLPRNGTNGHEQPRSVLSGSTTSNGVKTRPEDTTKNKTAGTRIMRSDSELLVFTFRPEKRMGLLTQSDFAKTDGTKSDLRIRWPKSSDFKIRRLDPSDSQIEKWERSLSK